MSHRSVPLFIAGLALFVAVAGGALMKGAGSARALTNCDTSEDGINGAEAQMLELINGARAQAGLKALKLSPNLNRAAAWKSADGGSNGLGGGFSHTDSLGRSPAVRGRDCGYASGMAENVAFGSMSASTIFGMWMGSSGHKANILMPGYTVMGIGQHQSAWTTDFGYNDDSGATSPPPATTTQPASAPTNTRTATPTQAAPTATPIPPTATPTTVPRVLSGVSLALSGGMNLVTYVGEPQPVAAAFQDVPGLLAVYEWDPIDRRWEKYAPGLPGYVQSFGTLMPGAVYYVEVTNSTTWAY